VSRTSSERYLACVDANGVCQDGIREEGLHRWTEPFDPALDEGVGDVNVQGTHRAMLATGTDTSSDVLTCRCQGSLMPM
jgi:hypothetical protein